MSANGLARASNGLTISSHAEYKNPAHVTLVAVVQKLSSSLFVYLLGYLSFPYPYYHTTLKKIGFNNTVSKTLFTNAEYAILY